MGGRIGISGRWNLNSSESVCSEFSSFPDWPVTISVIRCGSDPRWEWNSKWEMSQLSSAAGSIQQLAAWNLIELLFVGRGGWWWSPLVWSPFSNYCSAVPALSAQKYKTQKYKYIWVYNCAKKIIKGQLKSKSRQCIKDLFFIWNTVSKIISLEQFYKPCSKTFTLYIGKLSFLHVRTLNQHQCITNPLKSETKGRIIN